MAKGYAQIGHESIPGNELNTPTLSTKFLYPPLLSFNPQLNPAPLSRDDENRNVDEPLSLLAESYAPSWDSEVRAYPDSIGMFLTCMLGLPVTTAGDGIITDPDTIVIPVGATRHVWTAPFGPAGLSPKTLQAIVSYKDESTYLKMKGCGVSKLEITSPATGGARLKVSGPALYFATTADPALTPAYESLAIPPFERAHLTLGTWLASTGEHQDFSLAIDQPMEAYPSLGIASKFPDVMEKGATPVQVSATLPQRVIAKADLDALIAATGFAAVAKWISTAFITGAYPYKLFVSLANAQYDSGGPDPLSNARRIGGQFTVKATNAGAANTTITLVNGTASYT